MSSFAEEITKDIHLKLIEYENKIRSQWEEERSRLISQTTLLLEQNKSLKSSLLQLEEKYNQLTQTVERSLNKKPELANATNPTAVSAEQHNNNNTTNYCTTITTSSSSTGAKNKSATENNYFTNNNANNHNKRARTSKLLSNYDDPDDKPSAITTTTTTNHTSKPTASSKAPKSTYDTKVKSGTNNTITTTAAVTSYSTISNSTAKPPLANKETNKVKSNGHVTSTSLTTNTNTNATTNHNNNNDTNAIPHYPSLLSNFLATSSPYSTKDSNTGTNNNKVAETRNSGENRVEKRKYESNHSSSQRTTDSPTVVPPPPPPSMPPTTTAKNTSSKSDNTNDNTNTATVPTTSSTSSKVKPTPSLATTTTNIPTTTPDVKYTESVRNKAKRASLPGHLCTECSQYYQALEQQGIVLSTVSLDDMLKKCSRHKAQWSPPQTPEGFWGLSVDTPEDWR